MVFMGSLLGTITYPTVLEEENHRDPATFKGESCDRSLEGNFGDPTGNSNRLKINGKSNTSVPQIVICHDTVDG